MRHLSARRLVPAGVIAAAGVAALMVPGAASASLGAQCSGSNITGQGSTLQELAQGIWIPGFNSSTEAHACGGAKQPKVTYVGVGSGPGLESWGANGKTGHFEATNAFVGTDEAPNPLQKTEIEEEETSLSKEALLTIPVLQAAVAVIVHLPEKCVATSTSNKGRLVLNNTTLEGIERGTITKWSEITEGGDVISGTGCNSAETIKHIVRKGGSGTTHIVKKYLGLISKVPFPATNEAGVAVGNRTWDETAEGPENSTWPTADAVIRASKGSGVVSAVAANPSSIGYANVADARVNAAFVPPAGGPKTSIFWVPIQNKGETSGTVTYQDPASNKEVAGKKESNCSKEIYTNGSEPFPPVNVQASWSEVTTKVEEPKYTLCGLTFDLALNKYSVFPIAPSLEEATTVNNYLQFVVSTGKEKLGNKANGGQTLIKNQDYEPLVSTVLKEAQKGAALAEF